MLFLQSCEICGRTFMLRRFTTTLLCCHLQKVKFSDPKKKKKVKYSNPTKGLRTTGKKQAVTSYISWL